MLLNLKFRNVGSNLWLPKTHPRLKFPFPNTTSSLSDEAMFAGAAIVDTVRKRSANQGSPDELIDFFILAIIEN